MEIGISFIVVGFVVIAFMAFKFKMREYYSHYRRSNDVCECCGLPKTKPEEYEHE